MPELTTGDVEEFTGGRLSESDPATQQLLDAAVAAARRYCGWHVSPVWTGVQVVVDGPGGPTLSLPTLNLISVSAISECGVALDVSRLDVSRSGSVRHPYGCWTGRYGAVEVTMTHGFTEEEAADWRLAVLTSVDLADRAVSHGAFRAIGPFQYGASASFGPGSQFGEAEQATFDTYRIMLAP